MIIEWYESYHRVFTTNYESLSTQHNTTQHNTSSIRRVVSSLSSSRPAPRRGGVEGSNAAAACCRSEGRTTTVVVVCVSHKEEGSAVGRNHPNGTNCQNDAPDDDDNDERNSVVMSVRRDGSGVSHTEGSVLVVVTTRTQGRHH